MPINSVHSDYRVRAGEWKMNRDALEGERTIKDGNMDYLPAPPGMTVGSNEFLEGGKRVSNSRYAFYQSFAEFPEIVEPALNGFQGIIHGKKPDIELPPKMQYMLEDATPDGDKLVVLWHTITREVLSGGRVGLLCDVGDDDDLLRLVTYNVESVTNWRTGSKRGGSQPEFIVLREVVEEEREEDEYESDDITMFRELRLVDGEYLVRVVAEREGRFIVERDWERVEYFGRPFDEIPFVSINALDTGFGYGAVPITPLTRRALAIYRLTADYRRALYIKGDPQVVLSGVMDEDVPDSIGGERIWNFPNTDAKAEYLDIDGKGIPLMREAINDQYHRFWEEGARLLQSGSDAPESGTALGRREHSKQVSLKNVVINAANALEQQLKKIAEVLGEDPDLVAFKPDLDFTMPMMTGQEAFEWAQAQNAGFPISDEEMHTLGAARGVTELTFEETKEAMAEDVPPPMPPAVPNLDNRDAVPSDDEDEGDENGDDE